MKKMNLFYAQSGGVTSVINATAAGVIEAARKNKAIGKVYAGKNGILGALQEELIDTSRLTTNDLKQLKQTPGGSFGSCRVKLTDVDKQADLYHRLFEVFKAHNIGYFLYNGGGDSADTSHKIWQMSQKLDQPITCIGIPKTIDNDIPFTDTCPGFGSVAKYVSTSIREAGLDVASMSQTSTKVFILEVMGRHAGWIAAAAGLAADKASQPPHIILFPEIAFKPTEFLRKVKDCVAKYGFCAIVASEGTKNTKGEFLAKANTVDAFGHKQLGGVAPYLADLVTSKLKYKVHWALSDYLQRSARHIASKTDLSQAIALGKKAVTLAAQGKSGTMPIVKRISDSPYQWKIDSVSLSKVANVEKKMPRSYITKDGMNITKRAKTYLLPLIQGEAYPTYQNGLPTYFTKPHKTVKKKLKNFKYKK